jgi:hypothetical protein
VMKCWKIFYFLKNDRNGLRRNNVTITPETLS